MAAQNVEKSTFLVSLECSRAFHSLSIPLLLYNMSYSIIQEDFCYTRFDSETIPWFDRCLSDRAPVVDLRMVNDATRYFSLPLVARHVPQGIILGPFFVILYSSDIVSRIVGYCKLVKQCHLIVSHTSLCCCSV